MGNASSTSKRGLRMNPIVDVAQLRTRYGLTMALALAAGFLVVATFAWSASTAAALGLAVGIGIFVTSLALGWLHFAKEAQPIGPGSSDVRIPAWMSLSGICVILGGWQIVASRVFSANTSRWITFADALAVLAVTVGALVLHELSTERVVHSLEVIDASGGDVEADAEHRVHA